MSDRSVTSADLATLRDILALAKPAPPEGQVERSFAMLELLDILIGADWVSFQVIDGRHHVRPFLMGVESGEPRLLMTTEALDALQQELGEATGAFWDGYWISPCSLPERTGRPLVFSSQTFQSQREWRDSRGDEDLDLADELFLGYPVVSRTSARILVGRDEPGSAFGHRELALMNLLAPHLRGMLLRTTPAYHPFGAASATTRQVEILRLVGQGQTNREIGRTLGITEATVRKHLEGAYRRLGVPNRTGAVYAVFGGDPSVA